VLKATGGSSVSEETLKQVTKLHREFMRKFIWTSDQETYQFPEVWVNMYPQFRDPDRRIVHGDCEDIALAWCQALHDELGIPADKIAIQLCKMYEYSPGRYDHCVCRVILGAEHWILGNNQRGPVLMQGLRFEWAQHAYWSDPQVWFLSQIEGQSESSAGS
jgi:predicted transglutaminase-like cysteine proteinase